MLNFPVFRPYSGWESSKNIFAISLFTLPHTTRLILDFLCSLSQTPCISPKIPLSILSNS